MDTADPLQDEPGPLGLGRGLRPHARGDGAPARRDDLVPIAVIELDAPSRRWPPTWCATARELDLVHQWLDSWSGIGLVVADMTHQDWDVQLTAYAARDWRANFFPVGIAHSIVGGSAWKPTVGEAGGGVAGGRRLEMLGERPHYCMSCPPTPLYRRPVSNRIMRISTSRPSPPLG
jgi:hypothetical protein